MKYPRIPQRDTGWNAGWIIMSCPESIPVIGIFPFW